MKTESVIDLEKQFIESLKLGDRQTFALLYDRYGNNLFQVIVKIIASESEAENLLQDVFVKIWRNIHRYDASKGRLYTWLITIARRVAIDFVRSQYFKDKKLIQNEDSSVFIEQSRTEMVNLEYMDIDSIVAKLDAPQRQVIHLQYFMGYTQQEVADETGMPLGTIKSRTRTAMKNLRTWIKQD